MDTEQLTEEERESLEHGFTRRLAGPLIAKLLRIHDALRTELRDKRIALANMLIRAKNAEARVTELESRPPMVHLDRVPSLEERKVLRDLFMPPGMRTADLSDPTVLTSHWSVRCEECRVQGMSSHREDCSRRPKG